METKPRRAARPENRLLSGLSAESWAGLQPLLEPVSLSVKQVLVRPGEPIEHVYFLEGSMASIVAHMSDGAAVEVGMVGCEGMVGVPVVLGASQAPPTEIFVQIAGGARRITANQLRPRLGRDSALRDRLFLYVQARQAQVSQTAACNARHPLNQRLARWLLMASETVQRDELALTHEFLSMMLGVRRSGVTVALGALQNAGVISHAQGRISVLDRASLEATACECFSVVQKEYERLLG